MRVHDDEQSFRVGLGVLEAVQDVGVRGVRAVLLPCDMAHLPERDVRTHLSEHLEADRVTHDGSGGLRLTPDGHAHVPPHVPRQSLRAHRRRSFLAAWDERARPVHRRPTGS